MNKLYQNAARRLHDFVMGDTRATESELRAELIAEGVNVDAYLARLALLRPGGRWDAKLSL